MVGIRSTVHATFLQKPIDSLPHQLPGFSTKTITKRRTMDVDGLAMIVTGFLKKQQAAGSQNPHELGNVLFAIIRTHVLKHEYREDKIELAVVENPQVVLLIQKVLAAVAVRIVCA